MSNLKSVKVFLADGTNYSTSVGAICTLEDVKGYFLNQQITTPDERTLECIGLEFERQTVKGWKMLEAELRVTLMTQGVREGDIFNTEELQKSYKVLGFEAPFVVVESKFTGKRGCLQFSHMPRLYWGFVAE